MLLFRYSGIWHNHSQKVRADSEMRFALRSNGIERKQCVCFLLLYLLLKLQPTKDSFDSQLFAVGLILKMHSSQGSWHIPVLQDRWNAKGAELSGSRPQLDHCHTLVAGPLSLEFVKEFTQPHASFV